jgi:hypothetical protein
MPCSGIKDDGSRCQRKENGPGGLCIGKDGMQYCEHHLHQARAPSNFVKKAKRNPKTTTKQGYSKDGFVVDDSDED